MNCCKVECCKPECCKSTTTFDSNINLVFGKRLTKMCTPERLHKKLYQLLLYLYVSGSQVHRLLPISPEQEMEARELESKMKRRRHFSMVEYSESAALAVLRNYLEALPEPILDKRQWKNVCFQFFKNEALTVQSITYMGRDINTVENQMDPTNSLFFRHLIVVIREVSKDRRRRKIQFDRLVVLLDYLGPVMMRPSDKPFLERRDKLAGADKVFLTFVVCFAEEIFGKRLNDLFPPLIAFKTSNTYEPPFKLFG